jgi:hypothetical protein
MIAKSLLKQLFLFVVLASILVFLLGYMHEFSHFVACKSFGLESSVYINLFLKNPEYVTSCPGAETLSNWQFFVVRAMPYFFSMILMIFLFFLYKPKIFVGLALPGAIVIESWLNVLHLIDPFNETIDFRNDLLQIAVQTNKGYLFLVLLFMGVSLWLLVLMAARTGIDKRRKKK